MDSSDFYTNLLHTFVARNERWHVPKEFESKGLDFPKDCANTEGSYFIQVLDFFFNYNVTVKMYIVTLQNFL